MIGGGFPVLRGFAIFGVFWGYFAVLSCVIGLFGLVLGILGVLLGFWGFGFVGLGCLVCGFG